MSLRSLLFCADEASAQVLRRVLEELNIHAESCTEIGRAAIRLAQERFDVIILDCESQDEVNAMLRESRTSRLNDSTLTVAVVQGQDNIREMFSLGVNFVLYKPVSYERALSSLRAARALMRKERRGKARASVHAHANLDYANVEQQKATLIDLAEEGMAIHLGKKIPPSCKVYFQFDLPGQTASVRLSGQVVWQDWNGRLGIRFMDVPKASRRLLQEWLEKCLLTMPAPEQVSETDVPVERLSEPIANVPPPDTHSQAADTHGSSLTAATQIGAQTATQIEDRSHQKVAETATTYGMTILEETARPDSEDNRREQTRYACRLGAEVYRVGKTVPTRCSLTDLSPGGCYLEMSAPFQPATKIEIVVRTADMKLRLNGRVKSAHAGFGMGVFFALQSPEERAEVQRLIDFVAASTQ